MSLADSFPVEIVVRPSTDLRKLFVLHGGRLDPSEVRRGMSFLQSHIILICIYCLVY